MLHKTNATVLHLYWATVKKEEKKKTEALLQPEHGETSGFAIGGHTKKGTKKAELSKGARF